MNSLSTYYYPPTKILLPPNQTFKPRKDFGLNDTMNVYGCIQSSFKISDEFEKMLNGILKGDKQAVILMSLNKPFCKSQITRIYNLFDEVLNLKIKITNFIKNYYKYPDFKINNVLLYSVEYFVKTFVNLTSAGLNACFLFTSIKIITIN